MKRVSIFLSVTITLIFLLVSCGKSTEELYIEETTKTLNFHKKIADSLSNKWNDADLSWRLAHKDMPFEFKRHDMCALYLQKALSNVSETTPFDSIERTVNNIVTDLKNDKQSLEKVINKSKDFINSDEALKIPEENYYNMTESLFEAEMQLLNIETTIDALESGIYRAKNPNWNKK